LGQLAGTFRRVYLVMAQFGNQLELLGKCIDRTHANRNPVLIAAALALVLLIHRLELAAKARRHLPVEEFDHAPALVAATERDVAGIAETGARPFAVLNSESVATAEEADLLVLHSNGPAAVGIALVRFVDITDPELQLATGIAVKAADVEVMTVDVVVLENVVLAGEGVAVLQPADLHVLDAGAGCALVPVVEIGNVNVVTLVETSPRPQRTAVKCGHLAPFSVRLNHPRPAVVASELGRVVVFVIQRRHTFDTQHRTVIEGEQILSQAQLCILLALVTETKFRGRARQLKTGL